MQKEKELDPVISPSQSKRTSKSASNENAIIVHPESVQLDISSKNNPHGLLQSFPQIHVQSPEKKNVVLFEGEDGSSLDEEYGKSSEIMETNSKMAKLKQKRKKEYNKEEEFHVSSIGSGKKNKSQQSDDEIVGVSWRKRHRRSKSRNKATIHNNNVNAETNNGSPILNEDSIEKDAEKSEEESLKCLVARSSLVVPVEFKDHSEYEISELLLQRQVKSSSETFPLWKRREKLPREVDDLNSQFKAVLGYQRASSTTWTCIRLQVTEKAIRIFNPAELLTFESFLGELVEYAHVVEFSGIDLILYPLGVGILVFHINWLPEKQEVSLYHLRSLLFISKYRFKVNEVGNGWRFKSNLEMAIEKECLGEHLWAAYQNETISLNTISDWLVHLPGEDCSNPPLRHDNARHAYHHTTTVLDKQPSNNVLHEYLYHLKRAFGQKNRPPPPDSGGFKIGWGQIFIWRLNRHVALSREGTISLSWPINETDNFEIKKWHSKFQGIFLLLALHVFGEKLVFLKLSDMAVAKADALKTPSELEKLIAADPTQFEQTKNMRTKLRDLATTLVRYTLSLSSSDCGGVSEYAEFFRAIRQTFSIQELRDELSNELRDVLALVESTYLEEERHKREDEEKEHKIKEQKQKETERQKRMKDQRFELMIGILTSFTLPFVIVGGIFGMNLTDLPVQVPFWTLMGGTFLASMLLLALLLLFKAKFQSNWVFRFMKK